MFAQISVDVIFEILLLKKSIFFFSADTYITIFHQNRSTRHFLARSFWNKTKQKVDYFESI